MRKRCPENARTIAARWNVSRSGPDLSLITASAFTAWLGRNTVCVIGIESRRAYRRYMLECVAGTVQVLLDELSVRRDIFCRVFPADRTGTQVFKAMLQFKGRDAERARDERQHGEMGLTAY